MSLEFTYELMGRLISITVFLQGIEILCLRKFWSDQGLWAGKILIQNYEKSNFLVRTIMNFILNEKVFLILVMLQILVSLANIYFSHLILTGILLFIMLITVQRWRGTFNGGSDYMTFTVLVAHFLGGVSLSPIVQTGLLIYVAVQVVLSYTVSGIVKIKEKDWRRGKALTELMTYSNYSVKPLVKKMVQNSNIAFVLSWMILIFECSFVLSLLSQDLCLAFMGIGALFHLGNVYALGLNRFFFAWMSSYPALYFLSTQLR